MIRFSCKKCGCRISVNEENAGRNANCPQCKNPLIVPKRSNTIKIQCTQCGQKISVLSKNAGQTGRCPSCKKPITVPGKEKVVSKSPKATLDDTNTRLLGNDPGLHLLEISEELKLQDLLEKPPQEAKQSDKPEFSEEHMEDYIPDGTRKLPAFTR